MLRLFILSVSIALVSSQSLIPPVFYDVNNPAPFNDSNLTTTGANCDNSGSCNVPSKLSDNDFGPMDSLTGQLGRFFAFNQNDSRLNFNIGTIVSKVVVYFFNSPADAIGLPLIKVINAKNRTVVPYFFSDNDDLTQTDSQLRTVTLQLSQQPETEFRLDFFFPSYSGIDWLLVSEVQFYNGTPISPPMENIILNNGGYSILTLGLGNIQSSISLNCTVINNGSFEWQWEHNGVPVTDQVFIEDATRTSILNIDQLSYSNEGNYTCTADSTGGSSSQKRVNLSLTVGLATPHTIVNINTGQSVNISCQMTGYLRPGPIQWKRNNADVSNDGSNYIISTTTGDPNVAIDINGELTNGNISVLNILNGDTGTYTCGIPGTNVQLSITVKIGGSTQGSSSTTSMPTTSITSSVSDTMTTTAATVSTVSTMPSPSSTSTTAPMTSPTLITSSTSIPTTGTPTPTAFRVIPVVAGAAGGFIAIIIIVLVIVLLIVCILRKKQQRTYAAVRRLEHPMEQVTPVEPYYKQPRPILPYSETEFLSDGRPLTGNNQIKSEYSYIDHSTAQIMQKGGANDMYQEIPEPPSRPSPRPTPLSSTKPYYLNENPQYEAVTSHMSSEDLGSNFNIYATPNIPPPIPDYKGSLFDINIDPSHFTSEENLTRPSSMTDGGTPERLLPFPSTYANPTPLEKTDILEVTEENVKIISELGVGQFGKVFLAHTVSLTLHDLSLGSGQTTISVLVAVKVLHSDADVLERETFEKEVKFMSRLRNDNIVQILGVCLKRNAFIMMEYMENGDLNQYLQKFEYSHEEPVEDGGSYITSSSLIYIALQIASGMRYLAGKNYVHRDLATRNCLVGQKFLVKIADFGMSRQLYDNNYYRIRGRAMLPIRWMAKECFYGRFSEKTDVWAYGVVMWEIFTLCHCQPYEDFNDQEVIDNAIAGPERKLLSQPPSCPDEVYHVMQRCWVDDTEERATFEELHGLLAQVHAYA